MNVTSSYLPELDTHPIAFDSPENVAEYPGTPSSRNSTENSFASLSLEQQNLNRVHYSSSSNELKKSHEWAQLSRTNELIESPLDATSRDTPDAIPKNMLMTDESSGAAQTNALDRLSQKPHITDAFPELQQPRPHLAQPVLPALSIPPSPSISQRSLTPPPFSSTGEVPSKFGLLEPIGTSFSALPDYSNQSDRRRHSSVALSPTTDSDGLLVPVQFPEQRRYSLVDSGPISENAFTRATISNAGQDVFVPPTRRFINEGGSSSRSSSRSSSQPRTARFSTFAEMGIQSFAMERGEKTVETLNKGKRKKRDAKLKGKKGKDTKEEEKKPAETNDTFTESQFQDALDTNESEADSAVIENPDLGDEKTKDGKVVKAKEKSCIIM